jgi:ribose/xylose/arabinose/galactoside ABC-type transport system permease subunit
MYKTSTGEKSHPSKSAPLGAGANHFWKKFSHLKRLRKLFGESGIRGQILSLVILALLFGFGTGGNYLSTGNVLTIISLASIPAIIALGVHQVVALGSLDLSVEGVIAICAVAVGLLTRNSINGMDIGLWIIPVVMAVGGLAGTVNGLLHTKLRIPSLMTTLGINWVFFGLAILISGGRSIRILDPRFQPIVNGNVWGFPILVLLALVLALFVSVLQNRTRLGRYLYAVGGDEFLAKQAGVKTEKVRVLIFAMAGVFYGIAALLLVSRLNSSAARLGNGLLFPAMTAVAVGGVALTGGIGGAKNAILGALIVSALNNGLVMMRVSPYAQTAVNGFVLIVAVALTIDRQKLGFIK